MSDSSEKSLALRPQSIEEVMQLAQIHAKSGLTPFLLRGKPEDVFTILTTGLSLGVDASQALRGIAVVEGKPCLQADFMVGLCQRSDVCEYFTLIESTPQVATWETKRKGAPAPTRMSFTIEQAKAVTFKRRDGGSYSLVDKDNWRNYPDAMLRARCAAALARAVYSDLLFGMYIEDEAEDRKLALVEPSETYVEKAKKRAAKKAASAQAEQPAVDAEVVEDGEPAEPVSATTEDAPADEAPADNLPVPSWTTWRGARKLTNAIDFFYIAENHEGKSVEFIDFAPLGKYAGALVSELSTSDIHKTIANVAARLADGSLPPEDRRMVAAYYNALQREMLSRPASAQASFPEEVA